jgi:hypothetical protein
MSARDQGVPERTVQEILTYWADDARSRGHLREADELELALAAIKELIAAERECEAAQQQQRALDTSTNPIFYSESDLRRIRMTQRRLLVARQRRIDAIEGLGASS